MESLINKYSINIIWSDNDNGYIATSQEFPGLSAFGETPESAIAEARVAINLFIKTYEEDGIPVPEPQGVQNYSGQFRVRLPQSLHAQVARMADAEGVSQNQFVLDALAQRVGGQSVHDRTIKELRRAISELMLQINNAAQVTTWTVPSTQKYVVEQTEITKTATKKTVYTSGKQDQERGN